jgi:hypothetical protein
VRCRVERRIENKKRSRTLQAVSCQLHLVHCVY